VRHVKFRYLSGLVALPINPGPDASTDPQDRIRKRSIDIRTSHSHPLQIAEVETPLGCGAIGVTFCPGKVDPDAMTGGWARDLNVDLDVIRDWGAVAVVSLIEPLEMQLLKVEALGQGVVQRQMNWFHLPIPDFSIPDARFEHIWNSAGRDLRTRLQQGARIVVHCKGGLGRAGTIAARMLIDLGVDAQTAIARVRAVRSGAIETRQQEEYVRQLSLLADDTTLSALTEIRLPR
jgi:ADP-ribosyl-[dinitrogen reductase] hydrolase